MFNNKALQDLMQKEMNRKQFLQIVGAGILGLVGFTAFINNLDKFAQKNTAQIKTGQKSQKGYGASAYGR